MKIGFRRLDVFGQAITLFLRSSLLALLAIVYGTNASAQNASEYIFTPSHGTFNSLTGGIAVTDINADDSVESGIPIGFNFQFCGTAYTTVSACSNGWLSFGSPTLTTTVHLQNNTADLNLIAPALMPLWDDISGLGGSASYQTSGAAPNRIFTFEWRYWKWNFLATDTAVSFQVKLYEGTNIIQFVYQREQIVPNAPNATIGIARNTSDYLCLTDASARPAATAKAYIFDIDQCPATGQVYTFQPPTACAGTPVAGNALFSDRCPNIVYLSGTSAQTLNVQWQSRSICGGTWSNISGATNASWIISNQTSPTEYRAYVWCSDSGQSDTSTPVIVRYQLPCYCYPAYTNASVQDCTTDFISQVYFGSISNVTACSGTFPNNYSYYPGFNPTIEKGRNYPFALNTAGGNVQRVFVWIDYNRNGQFENNSIENVIVNQTATGGFYGQNILIPSNVATGPTRMRVRSVRATNATDPCASYNYGETEDYLITLQNIPVVTGANLSTTSYSATFCSGENISFTPSLPGFANARFLWKKPGNVFDTNAVLTINNIQPNQSGYYVVYGLLPGCPGGAPDTTGGRVIAITVNPTPPAPIVSSNVFYCQGAVPDSISVFGEQIKWYTVPTGGVPGGYPTINTGQSATYTFYLSQTIEGCEGARAPVTITVSPKPQPPSVVSPVGYCQGEPSVPLIANGQNIKWYPLASGGIGTPIAPTPSTSAQGAFTWYATQTVAGCESSRVPVLINVSYKPNGRITMTKPFVCQFDTITLGYFGNALTSAAYLWDLPGGASLQSGAGQGPLVVRFDSAGIQTVKLSIDNGGCIGPQTSIDVPVHLLPKVVYDVQPNACVGQIISLGTTYATMGIDSFRWDFQGAEVVHGSLPKGPFGIRWSTPGEKIVEVNTIDDGCKSIPFSDTIAIYDAPDVQITATSTTICAGDSIMLSTPYEKGASYQWEPHQFFGETNGNTAWGTIDFTRNVIVNVTSAYNCKGSDSITIDAHPCCQVYFPSAFSPNGDGRNDRFRMLTMTKDKNSRTSAHQVSSFRIQNRWGQTVFETADEREGWDGTFNGEPQDIGSYFFYVKYKCSDGNYYEEKGEVTLVR